MYYSYLQKKNQAMFNTVEELKDELRKQDRTWQANLEAANAEKQEILTKHAEGSVYFCLVSHQKLLWNWKLRTVRNLKSLAPK